MEQIDFEFPWGRKKRMITITCAGDLTEKQYEEVERRLTKILEKFDMGSSARMEWTWQD